MNTLRLLGLALVMLQSPTPSGVTDSAKLFSDSAVKKADAAIAEIRRETGWQVAIATIETLGDKKIADEARRRAEEANTKGLYVLLAKKENKLFVLPTSGNGFAVPTSPGTGPFTKEKVDAIIQVFMTNLRKGQFDQGLSDGLAEIRKTAVKSRSATEIIGVRDDAKMFSSQAVVKADEVLLKLHHDSNTQVLIQTVDSLGGETATKKAEDLGRSANLRGLLILIAKKEKRLGLAASRSTEKVFTKEKKAALEKSIESGFKAGDFDKTLILAAEHAREIVRASTNIPGSAKSDSSAPKTTTPPVTSPKSFTPDKPSETQVATNNPANSDGSKNSSPATAPPEPLKASPYLIYAGIGVGALILLWLIRRAFRKPEPALVPPSYMNNPPPPRGYGPQSQQAPPPGYAPAPPPGYAPAPPPGYGPGYGPPPQQAGGGGFVSGALGGMGGAVLGNILYDRFGRPHPEGHVDVHVHQDPTSHGPAQPHPIEPPRETFDPNTGVEGSWAEPPAPAPPAEDQWSGTGGSWGTPDQDSSAQGSGGSWGQPSAESGTEGSWGTPDSDQPPAQDWSSPAEEAGGGSWDAAPEADPNGAGGGDWGTDNSPQSEQGQEGSW